MTAFAVCLLKIPEILLNIRAKAKLENVF